MKTARVASVAAWGSQPAPTAEEIDAFAQQVLEENAAEGHSPDDSLGSYVVSMLRTSDSHTLTEMSDFDGLVELLQDQCGIAGEDDIVSVLETIATAVYENRLPMTHAKVSFSHGYASSISTPLATTSSAAFPALGDFTASSGPSDNQADTLLPQHLLEEVRPETKRTVDDEAFPPLGEVSEAKAMKKPPRAKPGGPYTSQNVQPAADVAAALFQHSRSRGSSFDETHTSASSSPHLTAMSAGHDPRMSSLVETPNQVLQPDPSEADPFYDYSQVQHILLTMNADLGVEAAFAAAAIANGDVYMAQYIFDCAKAAPPICRHLLQSGCYRSDCQFSHDIQNHTCIFWLRGRCGKGETCRFMHGFSESLIPQQNNGEWVAPNPEAVLELDGVENAAPESISRPVAGSFANIASQGYNTTSFAPSVSEGVKKPTTASREIPTVKIPLDLWNPHENRDSSAFYISDPMERYYAVMATHRDQSQAVGSNLVDLHFQSISTFPQVLSNVIPASLHENEEVWIVTGTGHHVGSRTHQKGGGALEAAVLQWLVDNGYNVFRGRDRNGLGGALLVQR